MFFDEDSKNYFINNLHKEESYENRCLIWTILEHEVDHARMSPEDYMKAVE